MESPPPWEPPLAADEVAHLLGALDRLRATFRWKADGLAAADLRRSLGPSTMTIAGLLEHLAVVEDDYSGRRLSGAAGASPWPDARRAGFDTGPTRSPEDLYARWDASVTVARERYAAATGSAGGEQLVHMAMPDGRRANLRRLLCDLIEEYGRHTGHIDLLRESIDGRVGEDPDASWRPPW